MDSSKINSQLGQTPTKKIAVSAKVIMPQKTDVHGKLKPKTKRKKRRIFMKRYYRPDMKILKFPNVDMLIISGNGDIHDIFGAD